LEKKLDSAERILTKGSPETLGRYLIPSLAGEAGELQPYYQTFYQAYLSFQNYSKIHLFKFLILKINFLSLLYD
jgi:hypothetical protein